MSILNINDVKDRNEPVKDQIISDDHQSEERTDLAVGQDGIPGDGIKEEDQKVVVMDGPLSKIYTEALNLALAKEAASASGQTDIKVVFDEDIEAQNEENRKALYVYCCDGQDMDIDGTIDATDKLRIALDSGKYKNVLVAMESKRGITTKAGLVDEFARKMGAQVVFSRNTALEAITM